MGDKEYGVGNETTKIDYSKINPVTGNFSAENVVAEATKHIPCDPDANDTAGNICSFLKYGGDE